MSSRLGVGRIDTPTFYVVVSGYSFGLNVEPPASCCNVITGPRGVEPWIFMLKRGRRNPLGYGPILTGVVIG